MSINIAFVGTCQSLSLSYFLQKCLQHNPIYNIKWVCYDNSFLKHLTNWSDKCVNKILNETEGIKFIQNCNYIIYHPIQESKSPFFNTNNLMKIKPTNCKMFSLQRIHIDYYNDVNNYNLYIESIKETKRRETLNNIDIKVAHIFENCIEKKYNIPLLLSHNHPTTYVFLTILLDICNLLKISYLTPDQYNFFAKNINYMELPEP